MIDYDRSAWWRVVFSFNGTVLPRLLGRVGILTSLALGLCLLDAYVLEVYDRDIPALDQLGHTVLGVALGLLIVFRTNTAYQRFWDARSHWGGMVNASRSLAREAAANAGPADDLGRLVGAYCLCVKQVLRGSKDFSEVRPLVPGRVFERLEKAADPPGVVARAMSDWVARRLAEGRLPPPQAAHLEDHIRVLVDQQGACEKVRKTPLPFVYAALIKLILLVYLATLPFVLVHKMGFAAPLVVAVVSLGFLGIEEAGVEIENPFTTDDNGLPLEAICETICRCAREATFPTAD